MSNKSSLASYVPFVDDPVNSIEQFSTKGTFIAQDTDRVKSEKIDSKIEDIKKIINELEKIGITKEEIIKKINE